MAIRGNRGGSRAAKKLLFVAVASAALAVLGCESSSSGKQAQAVSSAELPPLPKDYARIGTTQESVEERLNRLERDLAEMRIQYSGIKPDLDQVAARSSALDQRLAAVEQAFGPVTASISGEQRKQDTRSQTAGSDAAPLSLSPRTVFAPPAQSATATTTRAASQPAGTAPRAASSISSGWGAHLGSFREMQNAQRGWREIRAVNSDLLAGRKALALHFEMPANGSFQRVVVGPLASRDEAARLCDAFKQRGTPCNVLRLDATASLPLD